MDITPQSITALPVFRKGRPIKISAVGIQKLGANCAMARGGWVASTPGGTEVVTVRLKGNASVTSVHQSFIEPDPSGEPMPVADPKSKQATRMKQKIAIAIRNLEKVQSPGNGIHEIIERLKQLAFCEPPPPTSGSEPHRPS